MKFGKKIAVVIRGPSGAGKTPLIKELTRNLSKEIRVRCIILDRHSGVSSNHRPRSYHNLDSLSEDCILVELGDGGDATRNPQKWVDKLTSQGYAVYLFLLEATLDELRKRTATRADWTDAFTVGSWNCYRYDPNFIDFAKKLGLPQVVLDTLQTNTSEAAQTVLKSLT
ncbi:MAG: ATP-binding protein [Thaumarchaeota archaeon]|nr:ATP-binding protein [Nitrososphaerota archaeon]